SKYWNEIVEDPYLAFEMYNEMSNLGKLNLLPDKLLEPNSIALASLNDLLLYYGEVNDIEFAKKKTISFKGKSVDFYFYKVQDEPNGRWLLAFSGPFPTDGTEPDIPNLIYDMVLNAYSDELVDKVCESLSETN
ncbi:MAG: hypothetical protein C0594_07455, partial [Marinilabiliales bacterium]